jgi:hypothetical protein
MTPLAAGGAQRGDGKGPRHFEDGGSIAVQLIRGDVSASATGTVTHVAGSKVLAFGHPMFNIGEIFLPIATAEVHTFMSALSSSFKLASPLVEIGSLLQDRQSGIIGDTQQRAGMIPVRVTVGTQGRTPELAAPDPASAQTFTAEVVRHRFLTPMTSPSTTRPTSPRSSASRSTPTSSSQARGRTCT